MWTDLPARVEVWDVRDEPKVFCKCEETCAWYEDVVRKLLKAAHLGGAKEGKIDMSSSCPGQFVKQHGWRLLKHGTGCLSPVVTYVFARVENGNAGM